MDLQNYVAASVSPCWAVANGIKMLEEAGFQPVDLASSEELAPGKYYINYFHNTLFAFVLGPDIEDNLQMVGAHTDVPTIKIKPNGLVKDGDYLKFKGEVYGGMVLHSWLDRPLGLAGKVLVKGENSFKPKSLYYNSQRAVAMIPGLAIHLNREVNKGLQLNKQQEFVPVVMTGEKLTMEELLGAELNLAPEEILAYELNLYPVEEPSYWGLKEEFFIATGLDNLLSCYACLDGLIKLQPKKGLSLIALFDNEEVGSKTKQGAGSMALRSILEWIYTKAGGKNFLGFLQKGQMLSMDGAHGLHPNYANRSDDAHQVKLNKGIVIKMAANQSYATDGMALAILKSLCTSHNIPYQVFANHNEYPGGSTIGSIGSTLLPMLTADVGVPLWSMHSARETMGREDQLSLNKLALVWLQR